MLEKIRKLAPVILVFTTILIVAFFYCRSKQGFFLDEIYSYGLSNSNYAPFVKDLFGGDITDNILTKDMMLDYIAVTEEDGFDCASVYYNQTQDVLPPLYYFILHTVSSFFPNIFSKWFGLGVNLFFFVMTLLVLYMTVKRLFQNQANALIAIILYGLSVAGISTLLMARMYMLLTFLTVMLAYLFLRLLDGDKKWYIYVSIGVTIFAGLMTHYYYVFYAFFICAVYDIYQLFKRRYKDFCILSVSALVGVGGMCVVFPAFVQQLFENERTGAPILNNLLNLRQYLSGIYHMGTSVVLSIRPAVTLCIVTLLLLLVKRVNILKDGKRYNTNAWMISIPAILTFTVVSILVARKNIRYVYCIIPIIIIMVCWLLQLLFERLRLTYKWQMLVVFVVTVVSLGMFTVSSPNYIYKFHLKHNQMIAEYSDSPCIYISKNTNPMITSNWMQLLYFEEVCISDDPASAFIEEYLNAEEQKDELVVYIATYNDAFDTKAVLDVLCEKYGYVNRSKLYPESYASAYLLSK